MIKYHLTITIFEPFFQKKLDTRGKINSVWFADYDIFFEKILNDMALSDKNKFKLLNDMDLSDINKFKLNLFEIFKDSLTYINVTQFVNGEVHEGYCIPSSDFECSSNVIAKCIPSRKIRDKYFEWDCLRERYFVKSSFVFYLKQH